MTEYRLARPQEEADVLDFINMVFSMHSQPHDFAALLPKVYAHPGFARYHYVAVEDGHIRGTVALLPLTLRVEENCALKAGYIGSVAVHPYSRGAGHMKALMRMALTDAEAQGYDLLALGGRRQRYAYFGFEKGGQRLTFSLNSDNVRHAMADVDEDAVRIREVTDAQDAVLEDVWQLSRRQMLTCERDRERLLDIFHSWHNALYVLEDARQDGTFLGYLNASGDQICELALLDERRLAETLKAWMRGRARAGITVPMYQRVRASYLKSIAENYTVTDAHMLRVINWRHALETLLTFKAGYQPLCDGRFVFEVEDGGRYLIQVRDHEVVVRDTQETPDLCFTQQRAAEFFFSPYSALMEASPMLKSFLPVPFEIPSADAF